MLCLLFFSATMFSQECICCGMALDGKEKTPLAYVTIQLLRLTDSTLYAGAITGEQGKFLIDRLQSGNYLCRISYVGYIQKDTIVSIREKHITDLGKIELFPNQIHLSEVIISAQAPVSVKLDRTVYQVDNAMLIKSTSASELLSKIPELQVNKTTDNVIIKGKEKTTVMLNGVLSPVSLNLKAINPQEIDKIEIITAPASEYGTDIDGIVNIVLKEEVNIGYYFSLFGTWCANPWNRTSAGTTLLYGTKKIRYTFAYWYSFDNGKSQFDSIYRKTSENSDNYFVYKMLTNPEKRHKQNHFIENAMDFYCNSNNYFHFFTRHNIMSSSVIDRSNAVKTYFPVNLSDTLCSLYKNETRYNTGDYTLFYRKKFDNDDHKFTVNFNFHHLYSTDNAQYVENQHNALLQNTEVSRNDNTILSRYSVNLKPDYYCSLSKKITLNSGVLGYYQSFKNDYQDGGFSDISYRYSTLKNHFYVDLLFRSSNFGLRIGNKAEWYFAYMKLQQKVKYVSYLPSLALSQKINDEHTLRFNFRTVNYYPNIWILNPYLVYSADSMTAWGGNPQIQPSTQRYLALEYLWKNGVFSLNANVSFQNLHNEIMYESHVNQFNILVFSPNNIKGKNMVASYFNASLDFDFLYFSAAIKPYYEYFNNKINHRHQFDCNIDMSGEFYLPCDFEIDVYYSRYGQKMSSQGYSQTASTLDLYLSKKFLKHKMIVEIGYSGLICPDTKNTVIDVTNLYQWQQEHINYAGLNINVRYAFHQGKDYKVEQIEKFIENESRK
jgi:outer membrane cobalamin receptor